MSTNDQGPGVINMTTERNIVRHMRALNDQDLLELEAALQKEKQARHDCSHGLRFPELAAVVITCAQGLDTPDVRSHISALPSTAEFLAVATETDRSQDKQPAPGTAAHRDMVTAVIQLASVFGKEAFERGAPKIPSQDPAFMGFLSAHPGSLAPRTCTIQAWNTAWSTAAKHHDDLLEIGAAVGCSTSTAFEPSP